MIDIRAIVDAIVKDRGAKDTEAYRAHVHNLVRQYGVELLMNLTQAIGPSSQDEIYITKWLQDRVANVARQIPVPTTQGEKS